jgi:hypothetical protein
MWMLEAYEMTFPVCLKSVYSCVCEYINNK